MKTINVKNIRSNIDQDKIFDFFNIVLMSLLLIIFIWPLWFVIVASFSDPTAVWNGKVLLWPIDFGLECYKAIFDYSDIWLGYRNTIFYTVAGTIVNLIMTITIAYPLSRNDFMLRGFFSIMFMITMYFGGGLIPTYLVVRSLNMVNSPLAMIIPGAVSFHNVIITRTYFQNSIPGSLQDTAEIDGANSWQYLMKIVLPLSKPILAIMALYYGVGHWNSYFSAMIYLNDKKLYPLQIFLRNILISNSISSDLIGLDVTDMAEKAKIAETMKYGIIIVAAAPLLCVYPFIQKYFVKGVMIGAIKG